MFFKFRTFYWLIVANVTIVSILALKFHALPPQLPLFYSKPAGEEQLADTWSILILPLFMNLLFFLNNFVYRRYFKDDPLAKKIYYYLNLFIIVSLTLIFIKIIFVVT